MKQALCLLIGLCLATTAVRAQDGEGGDLTDPVEILKKADAACKAVKTVKYDVTFAGVGELEAKTGKVEASVIVSGLAYGRPEKAGIDVRATLPETREVRHITGGGDGELYYVIDHKEKKAYADIDPAVTGSLGRFLAVGLMIEFVAPEPFGDEIKGKVQELKGHKTIGGEDCYEVYVVYATEREQAVTWYISSRDFLPRGRVDEIKLPDGQKWVQQKMLSKLEADPATDDETYRLKLPEGYTQTDDFAP